MGKGLGDVGWGGLVEVFDTRIECGLVHVGCVGEREFEDVYGRYGGVLEGSVPQVFGWD